MLYTKKPPKHKPVRKNWATEETMGTNYLLGTITKVTLVHNRLRFEQLVLKSSSGYRELFLYFPEDFAEE